jgi:hypothetical protein
VSVEAAPEATVAGFALRVTVGAEPFTVTVAVALADPPVPVHVRVYCLVEVNAPVDREPLVARFPDQPPEPVHAVAFVELHVSVEAAPEATVAGFALRVTVGAEPFTVTVAAALADPPVPVHVRVYCWVEVNAPVDREPLVARFPDQPPEPVHEAAFVELQVSVAADPGLSAVGFALRVTVGAEPFTVTVAVALADPLAPVHVRVYCWVEVNAPVDWEPPIERVPDQPPEAVHEVAFVELQVSVAADPGLTVVGLALRVTVGAELSTVTVVVALADPPAPLHVRVYAWVEVNAPVDWEPLIGRVPDQPSEAVQDVTFAELHMSVAAVPEVTAVGFALRVTVGPGLFTVTVAVARVDPPAPVHSSVNCVVEASAPVD